MTINLIKKDYNTFIKRTVGTSLYFISIKSSRGLYLTPTYLYYANFISNECAAIQTRLVSNRCKRTCFNNLQKYVNLHVHIMKRSPLHPYLKSSKWKLGKLNVKIVV